MACVGLCEKIFDQAQTYVVPHAIELGIDGSIIGLGRGIGNDKVAAKLRYDGTVGECYNFGVDFVNSRSVSTGQKSFTSRRF